jgi:hypothetical protein
MDTRTLLILLSDIARLSTGETLMGNPSLEDLLDIVPFDIRQEVATLAADPDWCRRLIDHDDNRRRNLAARMVEQARRAVEKAQADLLICETLAASLAK